MNAYKQCLIIWAGVYMHWGADKSDIEVLKFPTLWCLNCRKIMFANNSHTMVSLQKSLVSESLPLPNYTLAYLTVVYIVECIWMIEDLSQYETFCM